LTWRLTDTKNGIDETAESQGNICGMRVILSQIADLFVVVSGLSDAELPEEICDSGVVNREIEGLAI
jgi:hypothetical protein